VSIIINIVKIDTMVRKKVTLMASLPSVKSQTIPQEFFSSLTLKKIRNCHALSNFVREIISILR